MNKFLKMSLNLAAIVACTTLLVMTAKAFYLLITTGSFPDPNYNFDDVPFSTSVVFLLLSMFSILMVIPIVSISTEVFQTLTKKKSSESAFAKTMKRTENHARAALKESSDIINTTIRSDWLKTVILGTFSSLLAGLILLMVS